MEPDKKKSFSQFIERIWDYRIEIFSGLLTLIGLILAFFYIHIGSTLVGLGFGLCFFDEMHHYFLQLRALYISHGMFKTLILVGVILFFLIAVPAFIIASAVGYGAMFLISHFAKR